MPENILLELHYLPSIQYFSKFLKYKKVWIEAHENYSKGAYRNRTHLASPLGVSRLSIPLSKGKNEQQSIQHTQIAPGNWGREHWRAIKSNYGNAPYFDFYADYLQPVIFNNSETKLFDFNLKILNVLLECLQLDKNYELTESYQKETPENILDFRNGIHPKPHRQKPDPHYQIIPYNQVFEEKTGFLPNLSILDLLFCTGPQAALILESSIKT